MIEWLAPVLDPRSAGLLYDSREAIIFHEPAWMALLHREYGFAFQAVCVVDGADVLAGLPLARVRSRLTGDRLVALPFSDCCAPLFREGSDAPEIRREL